MGKNTENLKPHETAEHTWAISFTCPKCETETATPITVKTGPHIALYCPKCYAFMKFANKTEKRFM